MIYQKLINFIKYHNAFTVGLLVLFIISTAVFADENVRDGIVGRQIKEVKGINNAVLLKVDLANFDLVMKIVNIQEDEEKFYVDYTFKTFEIKDNAWQEVAKDQVLTIDKKALGDRDFGAYIAKELGEVVDGQLVYLNKVQTQEKEKGQTVALETIDYTGLIGLVMSPKTKELMGYMPESEQKAAAPARIFKNEGSIQPEIFSAGQAAQKLLEIKMQEEQEKQRIQGENAAQNNNKSQQAAPVDVPLPASPAIGASTQAEDPVGAGAPSGTEKGESIPNNPADSAGVSGPASEVLPPDATLNAPSEQLTLPPAE